MVKIRLTRTGRKNYATYRVIAIDSRKPRDSKALEYLGYYLPHDKKVELNADRIKYWLSVGAQPSDTVARMLAKAGIIDKKETPQKKYNVEPGQKAKDRADQKAEKAEAAKAPKQEEPAAEPAEEAPAEVEEKPEATEEETKSDAPEAEETAEEAKE